MHNDSIHNSYSIGDVNAESRSRPVVTFHAGPLQFGIAGDYVATIAEWRPPTPLPHAPEGVLGVVSIQGRMLTVLDLVRLSGAATADDGYHKIVALRGDEQLALAASSVGESIELPPGDLENKTPGNERFVEGVFTHAGAEIKLLNASELFAAALQGRERRRRRF